jgi:RimJ/RimL family protein N-acetyltransferase
MDRMDRIKLVELEISDAHEVYQCVDFSRPHLKNLIWAETATLESVQDYIRSTIENGNKMHGIRKIDTNEFVGVIELRNKTLHCEVGYWIDIRHRGNKYASEALRKVIDETGVYVRGQVRLENLRSQGVMKRAGMIEDYRDDKNIYYMSEIRIWDYSTLYVSFFHGLRKELNQRYISDVQAIENVEKLNGKLNFILNQNGRFNWCIRFKSEHDYLVFRLKYEGEVWTPQ